MCSCLHIMCSEVVWRSILNGGRQQRHRDPKWKQVREHRSVSEFAELKQGRTLKRGQVEGVIDQRLLVGSPTAIAQPRIKQSPDCSRGLESTRKVTMQNPGCPSARSFVHDSSCINMPVVFP